MFFWGAEGEGPISYIAEFECSHIPTKWKWPSAALISQNRMLLGSTPYSSKGLGRLSPGPYHINGLGEGKQHLQIMARQQCDGCGRDHRGEPESKS